MKKKDDYDKGFSVILYSIDYLYVWGSIFMYNQKKTFTLKNKQKKCFDLLHPI